MRAIAVTMLVPLLGRVSHGGEVRFSSGPTAKRVRDKVRIAFAVSKATDVEVAVLDSGGKVVRHLAAGVLGGKKPPPEPLGPGLSQKLEWDMRDDFGEKASGGPFKLRVRAGTGVKFGRTISDSPYVISDIRGLATDEDANLYVLNQNFGYGSYYIQVFDAEGKYLRTIMPFPANLPKDSAAAFAYWDAEKNRHVARNWLDVYASFLPVGNLTKTAKFSLLPAVSEMGVLMYNTTTLYRLDRDGGTGGKRLRFARMLGRERMWPGKKALSSKVAFPGAGFFAALSPDGKTVYAAGPCSKPDKDGKPLDANWPAGCIYSMKLAPDGKLEPFSAVKLPADWLEKCKGPHYRGGPVHGLATDARGNVYLADRTGGGVIVFDPAGKKLGAIPVRWPHRVAVHPKSGAVYVLTLEALGYRRRKIALLKFSGWKNPRQLAELEIGVKGAADPVMVLGVRGEKTVLWLAGAEHSGMRVGRTDVTRYEETGAEFVPTARLHEKDRWLLGNHDCIAVDPFTEDVYINDDYSKVYRYNGLTGKRDTFGTGKGAAAYFAATDLTVGPRGYLYVRTGEGYSGPFERLDRNLKPAPLGGTATHVFSKYIYSRYGAGYGEKGIGVGRDGKSYITFMYGWTKYCTAGFGPDGRPLKGKYLEGKVGRVSAKDKKGPAMGYPAELTSAIIGPVPRTNGGVRVDSKGNIYIGVGQLPRDYVPPAMFAKDRGWKALVGSVVKFGPEGGGWIRTNEKTNAIKEPPGEVEAGAGGIAMEAGHFVEGAKQVYVGIAPFSGSYGTGRDSIGKRWCDCRSARFDIDLYDRLYLPNCVTHTVRICDEAGNVVLDFGGYANYDSQYIPPDAKDGKPAVPVPYVPLGWPIGVGVSDEHIYVCDQLNRSIVRADKTYAAEETCRVR